MPPSQEGLKNPYSNPFRPGAGHTPPYLAGRDAEKLEFQRLLGQEVILQNLVLSGLRGVGKTVLLDSLKPLAIDKGWFWVGTDLSEATSVSETSLAIRLLTDLAVVTSDFAFADPRPTGFVTPPDAHPQTLDFAALCGIMDAAPGLTVDKLKAVLEIVWSAVDAIGARGVVFAYDEAQNLGDHRERGEYPLSTLLDVFQSVQRKGMRQLLVLTGLPTLFARLVESRTYAERMFRTVVLEKLSRKDTDDAIRKPLELSGSPVRFNPPSLEAIYEFTLGYPYFIQYVCREVFDLWAQDAAAGKEPRDIPFQEIARKLDSDFFMGRWARATDRQRDLLGLVARLETAASEFSVQEIVAESKRTLPKPFSPSHVSQLLASLCDIGLVYKTRWGKYALAVPLLDRFIRRESERS